MSRSPKSRRWILSTRFASPRSKWSARSGACLAERGGALIGRVFQHFPDSRAIPPRLARGGRNLFGFQPTTRFADRDAVAADPLEDLLDHRRLFVVNLIRRFATALAFGDVAIAIRRT